MAYVAQHAFHHLEEHLELTAVELEAQTPTKNIEELRTLSCSRDIKRPEQWTFRTMSNRSTFSPLLCKWWGLNPSERFFTGLQGFSRPGTSYGDFRATKIERRGT